MTTFLSNPSFNLQPGSANNSIQLSSVPTDPLSLYCCAMSANVQPPGAAYSALPGQVKITGITLTGTQAYVNISYSGMTAVTCALGIYGK